MTGQFESQQDQIEKNRRATPFYFNQTKKVSSPPWSLFFSPPAQSTRTKNRTPPKPLERLGERSEPTAALVPAHRTEQKLNPVRSNASRSPRTFHLGRPQPLIGGLEPDREGAVAPMTEPAKPDRAQGLTGRRSSPPQTRKGAVPERIGFSPPILGADKLQKVSRRKGGTRCNNNE